jgi:HD-like signal output (HDOD) protein
MKKILFVDDERPALEAMQQATTALVGEWEMTFVSSGAEALATAQQIAYDVIVADMRMPGMDGGQLLGEIRTKYPHIVRIIVSPPSDQQMIQRSIGTAHQFVPKPLDIAVLKATVTRACTLRDLLTNDALKKLVSGMQSLPSLPTLYREIMAELQSPNASLKKAGQIVTKDMAMVTKILQWVNSPFYGLPVRISNAEQAVSLLGLDTIKSLVLSTKVFSQFEEFRLSFFSLEVLQRHGLVTAKYAKAIGREENAPQALQEDAFTAGLLHDVGILVLAANMPEKYAEILAVMRDGGLTEWEAERKIVGASHAEIGGYLLGMWGLSEDIVEAVAFHHEPGPCARETFSAVTAVHVGNVLDEEDSTLDMDNGPKPAIDDEYVRRCGLSERYPMWRAACLGATSGR